MKSRPVRTSSLEVARYLYLSGAALSVRESLLFARGDSPATAHDIPWQVRAFIVFGFLTTLFRYSHGVTVVYDLEKAAAQESTTPSPKRLEWIFAAFMLEAVAFFLMSGSLDNPVHFIWYALLMLVGDMFYINVSQTIRSVGLLDRISFFLIRWTNTTSGTAARTHIVWALSNLAMAIVLWATMARRIVPDLTGLGTKNDWLIAIGIILIVAAAADYWLNSEFYFSGSAARGKRPLMFVCTQPIEALAAGQPNLLHPGDMTRLLWHCRHLYEEGKVLPFAPEAFLGYFLHNTERDVAIRRQCILAYLERCDAFRVYSETGLRHDVTMEAFIGQQLEMAVDKGLAISVKETGPPSETFLQWKALDGQDTGTKQVGGLTSPFEWVFLCTPLREHASTEQELGERVRENIRRAQWLCHHLLTRAWNEGKGFIPIAPHAFYPYLAKRQETLIGTGGRITWLGSALETIRYCDTLHVYTPNGLNDPTHITDGMRECIVRAIRLGVVVEYKQWPKDDWQREEKDWRPATWGPPKARKPSTQASEKNLGARITPP